eukprot:scaffold1785_cov247-Pinguiococcus_pyrenoidosus.AAC.14
MVVGEGPTAPATPPLTELPSGLKREIRKLRAAHPPASLKKSSLNPRPLGRRTMKPRPRDQPGNKRLARLLKMRDDARAQLRNDRTESMLVQRFVHKYADFRSLNTMQRILSSEDKMKETIARLVREALAKSERVSSASLAELESQIAKAAEESYKELGAEKPSSSRREAAGKAVTSIAPEPRARRGTSTEDHDLPGGEPKETMAPDDQDGGENPQASPEEDSQCQDDDHASSVREAPTLEIDLETVDPWQLFVAIEAAKNEKQAEEAQRLERLKKEKLRQTLNDQVLEMKAFKEEKVKFEQHYAAMLKEQVKKELEDAKAKRKGKLEGQKKMHGMILEQLKERRRLRQKVKDEERAQDEQTLEMVRIQEAMHKARLKAEKLKVVRQMQSIQDDIARTKREQLERRKAEAEDNARLMEAEIQRMDDSERKREAAFKQRMSRFEAAREQFLSSGAGKAAADAEAAFDAMLLHQTQAKEEADKRRDLEAKKRRLALERRMLEENSRIMEEKREAKDARRKEDMEHALLIRREAQEQKQQALEKKARKLDKARFFQQELLLQIQERKRRAFEEARGMNPIQRKLAEHELERARQDPELCARVMQRICPAPDPQSDAPRVMTISQVFA